MNYSANPNCKYKRGESNPGSKLSVSEVSKIRIMSEYKDKRLNQIDTEIEKLKIEKERIKTDYSQKQIAMDFGVKPITIRRIQSGTSWK